MNRKNMFHIFSSLIVFLFLLFFYSCNNEQPRPKINELISKYQKFEQMNNYSEEMFSAFDLIYPDFIHENRSDPNYQLNCNDLNIEMIFLRLKFYKGIKEKNESEIKMVRDIADNLITEEIISSCYKNKSEKKLIQNYLSALKNASFSEKKEKNIILMIATIIIFIILVGFLFASGGIPGLITGIIIGAVLGLISYNFLLDPFFHKKIIEHTDIPPVPIVKYISSQDPKTLSMCILGDRNTIIK